MKKFKLAAAAITGGLAAAGAAQASPVIFNSTGSLQTYDVTQTGDYEIIVDGAQGGAGGASNSAGGNGVSLGGEILLNAGTTLDIIAGGQGTSGQFGDGGGGGGGSFVYINAGGTSTLLAAAGGGGGGGGASSEPGGNAQTANSGGAGLGSGSGTGGTSGAGGKSGSGPEGGGGAGWSGNGAASKGITGGQGGKGPAVFTGGSAILGAGDAGGGGGGSYLEASFFALVTAKADWTGDGEVTITELNAVATPAPSSIASFAAGLFGLGVISYRRRRTIGLP